MYKLFSLIKEKTFVINEDFPFKMFTTLMEVFKIIQVYDKTYINSKQTAK